MRIEFPDLATAFLPYVRRSVEGAANQIAGGAVLATGLTCSRTLHPNTTADELDPKRRRWGFLSRGMLLLHG